MTQQILPGGTLGILGGGNAGRLITLAARSLGYRVIMLDPDPAGATDATADRLVARPLDDLQAVAELARSADVVTTALEQLPMPTARTAEQFAPLRPGSTLVGIAQDRARERAWLAERQVRLGRWSEVDSPAGLAAAVAALGGAAYVKPRLRLEDGTRPILVTSAREAQAAWVALRGRGCVVEEVLPIDLELSVLVGRTPLGAMVSYPTALSYREHTAHLWSVLPADIAPQLDAKAQGLATFIASRLALEGLLAVEMFLLRDGQLVVNELVPCPHHTYLGAELACATGQHEQLVRAVCGLPLGSTRVVQPTAVVGVPGELWHGGKVPAFDEALRLPGVRLHIVDRREPRIGTAVGYLCATADSAEDAVGRALLARAELIPDRTRRAIMRRVPGVAALRRRGTTAL